MKSNVALLSSLLFISGCSSIPFISPNYKSVDAPPRIEVGQVITPLIVPDKPRATVTTMSGERVAVFNQRDVTVLNEIYESGKANEQLLTAVSKANINLVQSYNNMVDIYSLQERRIVGLENDLYRSEQLRRAEQAEHTKRNIIDKATIGLIILLSIIF